MNIHNILKHYDIDTVIETKQMDAGNSSDAIRIDTVNQKYILRNLKDKTRALTEYRISEALKDSNIAPEILVTKNNQPYAQADEEIYNLQTYIESEEPRPEIDFKQLDRVVGLFHKQTNDIEGIHAQADRFSLADMYKQLIENRVLDSLNLKDKLVNLVEECLVYKHDDNSYIHGDLGVWNMLINGSDIYLIDFGEVRRGNNHFDIAAVLTSTIDLSQSKEVVTENLKVFLSGYTEHFADFDLDVLKENIKLWVTRGILAILIDYDVNEKSQSYVMNNIETIKKLALFLNHL